VRKSNKEKQIEERFGKPMEQLLPDLYNQASSITEMARVLGVRTSQLWYWFMKYGFTIQRKLVKRT